MGSQWLFDNFMLLLNAAGIIGGLLFTGYSFAAETRTRRIGNLLTITEHHRDIWTRLYERPELSRVLRKDVDLANDPITEGEKLFITLLILHLYCVYQAMNAGVLLGLEGLKRDLRNLYLLPIPKAVWEMRKTLQDKDFVAFVDGNIRERKRKRSRGAPSSPEA